jgi:hypothetical protein
MVLCGANVPVKWSIDIAGGSMNRKVLALVLLLALPASLRAQKAAAPVDLTGYWVSLVTEDWRWRMITPPKGDYAGMPLNAEGKRLADQWDPAKDEAEGNQCKAYGAPGIIRIPGRLHVTWENDTTLRMDIDAGNQARLFRFGQPQPAAGPPSFQGNSVATWEVDGGQFGVPKGGYLRVITTGFRPGYVRKNGVPYSDKGVLTEYIYRFEESNGQPLLFVISHFEDPQYLNQRLVMTTQFKKEADGSKWSPAPCSAR